MLFPDRVLFWIAFTGVFAAPIVALWTFAMLRSARRAEITNRTADGPIPATTADRLAALPPAAFVGLMSTWLVRALLGVAVEGLDVTLHPAIVGVPLATISVWVAIATYQRILADWRS